MSADSWVKFDGFEKFKIMVVRLDIMMEKNEKQYQFSIVFYDFEKLTSYLYYMNQNFVLSQG